MKIKTIIKLLFAGVMLFQGSQVAYAEASFDKLVCIYPDSDDVVAPDWVCDVLPANVELGIVGFGDSWLAAFSEALVQFAEEEKSRESLSVLPEDSDTTLASSKNQDVSVIGNVVIKATNHQTEKSNGKSIFSSFLTESIIHFSKGECKVEINNEASYAMKNNEESSKEKLYVTKENCGMNDLLQELKQEGVTIVEQIISPNNNFYILLGRNSKH